MSSLTDEQIVKIETFSQAVYLKLDDTHDLKHAEKTEKLAVYLASQESGDILISRLGALLHQYHPEGVSQVDSFLEGIGVEEEIRNQLVHCVRCVEIDTIHEAETIEAKIVFDADKLQTLGPYGFIREVVYRTRKKNITFIQAFEEAKTLQDLVITHLQTDTAKRIYQDMRKLTRDVIDNFEQWNELAFVYSIPDK